MKRDLTKIYRLSMCDVLFRILFRVATNYFAGHCLLTFGHQNNGRFGVMLNGTTVLKIFDVQVN